MSWGAEAGAEQKHSPPGKEIRKPAPLQVGSHIATYESGTGKSQLADEITAYPLRPSETHYGYRIAGILQVHGFHPRGAAPLPSHPETFLHAEIRDFS